MKQKWKKAMLREVDEKNYGCCTKGRGEQNECLGNGFWGGCSAELTEGGVKGVGEEENRERRSFKKKRI